jgi:hypothetical protein
MDLQLIELKKQRFQWMTIFVSSLILWITPVGLKAPRLLIFISLPSAIAGFGYCANSANKLNQLDEYNNKMGILLDELESYDFALKEQTMKEQLRIRYSSLIEQKLIPFSEEIFENASTQIKGLLSSNEQETVNSPVNKAFGRSEQQNSQLYTLHQLPANEAALLVNEMQSKGAGKSRILESLWGVKRGAGKSYKAANAEYEYLSRILR